MGPFWAPVPSTGAGRARMALLAGVVVTWLQALRMRLKLAAMPPPNIPRLGLVGTSGAWSVSDTVWALSRLSMAAGG